MVGTHARVKQLIGSLLAGAALLACQPASAAQDVDKLELIAALQRRDFAGLERRITTLQAKADDDIREEQHVQQAFDAFAVARPELEPPLREWVEKSPKSWVAQLALATHYSQRGWHERGSKFARDTSSESFARMNDMFAKAIEGASTAIALHPTATEGYSLLINIAMARGENEREVAIAKRALEKSPASYRVRRTIMQTLRPRWGGSYPAMLQFAADSQRWAKENPRLETLLGLAAWDMGTVAVHDKNYGAGVTLFTGALEAGPSAEVYASRADAYVRMKDYEKALADANESLLLRPQVAEVLADRAVALGAAGHVDVAVADVELATKLDGEDDRVDYARDWVASALVRAGCALDTAGKYDEALSRFDAAVKLDPKSHEAFYRRGRTYGQKGRLVEARDDLERAIALNPRYFEAYRTLDWVLGKEGRWDDVIARWNEFIALEPQNANAFLERAGSYRHKGDMPSALKDLRSACDLGNGNACQIIEQHARR